MGACAWGVGRIQVLSGEFVDADNFGWVGGYVFR